MVVVNQQVIVNQPVGVSDDTVQDTTAHEATTLLSNAVTVRSYML